MATRSATTKRMMIARLLLAAIYLIAGCAHMLMPHTFLSIMPGWVPFPLQVILATGVCELAGAAGLLTRRFRRAAGIALALYAICVFPANIQHAINDLAVTHMGLGWGYHVPRLAFQPVLVWWALFAGEVVDWPFRLQSAGAGFRRRPRRAPLPRG